MRKATNVSRRGFTLIELMVVVLIIGILSSIALPQYTKSVERARASECVMGLENAARAFELYRLENRKDFEAEEFIQNSTLDVKYMADNGAKCGWEVNGDRQGMDLMAWPRDGSDYKYSLEIYYDKGKRTKKACFTENVELGRSICKSLEGQGWEYVEGLQ